MLSGACFRDDPLLSHSDREQTLAETVIDLVRAGMVQIFAFEVNPGAAPCLCKPLGEIERSRPSGIILEEPVEFRMKFWISLGRFVGFFQFLQRMHERFGHKLPAIISKMTFHGVPISATSVR